MLREIPTVGSRGGKVSRLRKWHRRPLCRSSGGEEIRYWTLLWALFVFVMAFNCLAGLGTNSSRHGTVSGFWRLVMLTKRFVVELQGRAAWEHGMTSNDGLELAKRARQAI